MKKLSELSDDVLLFVDEENLVPRVMTKEMLEQKIKSGEMYRNEIFAYLAIEKSIVFTEDTIRDWFDQLEDVYDQHQDWVGDMMVEIEKRDETKKFLMLLNKLSNQHMTYDSGELVDIWH